MNILVTGGAGFIGSHIVDACVEAGHAVTVIDDLSTGHRSNVNPGARFLEMDIRSPELDRLFRDSHFEVVSHQAARADVRGSMRDPFLYADVNIGGGINLLEAARRHGVRKVVYSSTLDAPLTERTRVERNFDPGAVRELKAAADGDLLVGGPNLAGQALAAGLVDEVQLFVWPVVLGGRNPALQTGMRVDLELIDEHRFGNGVIHKTWTPRGVSRGAEWQLNDAMASLHLRARYSFIARAQASRRAARGSSGDRTS